MERFIDERVQSFLKPFYPDLNGYLDKIETNMEAKLIDQLGLVMITASKKTDKHSLPYQHEIVVKLVCESYVAGSFEFDRVFRPIVKELLNKNVYKIRFYLHVETYSYPKEGPIFLPFGGIKYSFRYFIH